MYIKRLLLYLVLCFLQKQTAYAQGMPVSTTNGVYTYLNQMALSYEIQWYDLVKPATRTEIAKALQALLNQMEILSPSEYKEAQFYWKAFGDETKIGDTLTYLKKGPTWQME